MNSDQISRQFPGAQLESPVLSPINIQPIPLDLNSWIQILGWMWSASSPWREGLIGKKMWLCSMTMWGYTCFQSAWENWEECYQQCGEVMFDQLLPGAMLDKYTFPVSPYFPRDPDKGVPQPGLSVVPLLPSSSILDMCFCVCPLTTAYITTPETSGNSPGMPLLQVNSSCQTVFEKCCLLFIFATCNLQPQ